jgi:hypothetical protein
MAGLWTGAASAPLFEDVTVESGVVAAIVQDKPAGGVGVADFDRNGFPDLLLTGYSEPNRLWFNNGDGTFSEREPFATQLSASGPRCTAVAAADFDNDGWTDAYLACNGDNLLLRNLGAAGFADVTTPAVNHPRRSEGAVWADFNRDGHLDLVVVAHPPNSTPDPSDPDNYDRILISDGAGGFVDVARGFHWSMALGNTLGLIAADFDLDGWTDLYIANDRLDGNVLLRNAGPGCDGWCFEDVSLQTGADRPAYSMGATVADHDRDGDWDLYYSSMNEQVFLRNDRNGPGLPVFVEATDAAGNNAPYIGWGVQFLDADNDGREDLFLALSGPAGANEDRLFHQRNDETFISVGSASGLHQLRPTEAAAWIDYDRDGRPDLALGHSNDAYGLYRNSTVDSGRWIGFRLEGGGGVNRDAIGTRVVVETPDGTRQQRERRAGESRNSTNDGVLLFGLGAQESAAVTIHWPDGTIEAITGLTVDRYHHRAHPAIDVLFRDDF